MPFRYSQLIWSLPVWWKWKVVWRDDDDMYVVANVLCAVLGGADIFSVSGARGEDKGNEFE
jgi:hypothetical protein